MFGSLRRAVASHSLPHQIDEMRKFTPDMIELEKQIGWPYFCPDEMQENHPKNYMLHGQVFLHQAFTQCHYAALKQDLGKESSPLIFEGGLKDRHSPPPSLPVKGELGIIHPTLFPVLDSYKQNGVSFYRKLVPIVLPCTELFFKDRQQAQAVFEQEKPTFLRSLHANEQYPEGVPVFHISNPVNRSLFKNKGVFRIWAWMYFADHSFWDKLLWKVAPDTVAIHTARNELIKRCYYFTPNEYIGPNDSPF